MRRTDGSVSPMLPVLAALAALGVAAGGCHTHILQAVTLPAAACDDPAPTSLLDEIAFGDAASESAHAFVGPGTIPGTGASGETTRRIDVGAPLAFQLATSPTTQNYVTVKLSGSDPDPALLFLYVAGTRVGGYGQELPELDFNPGESAFPQRFVYVTYPLPRAATDGKISVALKIDAIDSYSQFVPPDQAETPLTQPTRPLYRAYTHVDPYFVPSPGEVQGTPPAPLVRPAPADYPNLALIHQQADAAVAVLLASQLYGDSWAAAVAAGQVPAGVWGLFGNVTPTRFTTAAAWRDWAVSTTTAANAAGLQALAAMAFVHGSAWSQYHASPEILSRVTRALDSLMLMQGANGAFTSATWVGAPTRTAAAGSPTEGSGTKAIGRAFVLLADALNGAGLLDAPVDDDDDGATPAVPRRRAWADMFARHRDFLASAPGRSLETMYDQSQIESFGWANEALRILAPARALSPEAALAYVQSAVGITDGPAGAPSVSPRGLPLMPSGVLDGGYDGRWGILTIRSMCALARLTADAAVSARCLDAVHATAPFIYPASDGGFYTMRAEGAIAAVINRSPGYVDYGGSSYAAEALDDPVALRAIQLRLAHHAALGPPTIVDVHFPEYLAGFFEDLPAVEAAIARPDVPQRLPMEDGQPDAVWADAVAGSAAVRNCGDRLYATLNWRRGFTDGVADAQHARVNDIARLHLTRDRYDRIATITMSSPFGFGRFYAATYGPYTIGMNVSPAATYDFAGLAPAVPAFELVERRAVSAAATVAVPPGETRVLYGGRQASPP